MRSHTSARGLSAALVGGASLALYVVTLAPAITWANFGTDGGDLITAAVTLGVPHPPGYPLYTTLGYLFAQLPIGTVAFRLNLLSAVCMALAAALTTWSVTTLILTPAEVPEVGVGVLAGLAFATAPMVWGQATMAEVHALNALFVAAIVGLLNPIVFRSEGISSRRLSFAFFLWGLGLTNQLTLLALAPFFFIALRRSLVTARHSSVIRYSSLITHYALPCFIGLTPYLLLLSRAAAQPPINWLGDVTPANFWSLITADLYRGYAFTLPPIEYLTRLIALAQLLVTQFGWIGLGLIGLGLYRAGQRARAPLISSALYAIFALGYNTADSQLYLIPVWLFSVLAIAAGAQAITQYALRFTRHSSLVTLVLIALIPGWSVLTNFAAQDLHADYAAEQFAQRVLTAAPANALLITHIDAHTFTLWYYRLVEKRRSDVTVIDARLAAYPWYDPMLRAQDARRAQDNPLNNVEFDPETTWLDRLRAANPARLVCDLDPGTARLNCP